MADDILVPGTGSRKVRSVELGTGSLIQVVRVDYGLGTAEQPVTPSQGLPVSIVYQVRPSAAVLTNVNASASSVTLVGSNVNRLGLTIVNDSDATLYVKFGSVASPTSFTYLLNPHDTLELAEPVYTGQVDGIWSSATGAARISEL